MATARQRLIRHLALSIAWLQSSKVSAERIQEFIRCGEIADTSRDDIEPYDPELVKAIVNTGRA